MAAGIAGMPSVVSASLGLITPGGCWAARSRGTSVTIANPRTASDRVMRHLRGLRTIALCGTLDDPMRVISGPPVVTLRSASARPYDTAIAAARTCYAPRVVGADEITPAQRDSIGPLTFDAGHHTVWQHAQFEFGLENVSRQMVWSFLHSHPFYNSEQSSQRFVRLDEIRAHVPEGLGDEAHAIYEGAIESAWQAYRRLTAILRQDTLRILTELRHLGPRASDKRRRRVEREAEKKAIEIARYVIPVAAFTSMVHTVSGVVLHRLRRMALSGDAPAETRAVVERMVALACEVDPLFFERVGQGPLAAEEIVEARLPHLAAGGDAEAARLDALLGSRTSLLVDHMPRAEQTTADAVRAVLGASPGALGDDAALELLLNPGLNRYRLETLQLSVHSPLGRAMHHASYTFLKKLSHTADSQDQRHRMVPGSRPLMTLTDTRKPDYVTPPLLAANAQALEVYAEAIESAWARQEPPAGAGRASRESALPASERQGASLPREREPSLPGPQVGDAHLLQRAGGDLPRLDRRARAGAGPPPAAGPPHGSALRDPQRPRDAALHRGRTLLRRARLAVVPERHPPALRR